MLSHFSDLSREDTQFIQRTYQVLFGALALMTLLGIFPTPSCRPPPLAR